MPRPSLDYVLVLQVALHLKAMPALQKRPHGPQSLNLTPPRWVCQSAHESQSLLRNHPYVHPSPKTTTHDRFWHRASSACPTTLSSAPRKVSWTPLPLPLHPLICSFSSPSITKKIPTLLADVTKKKIEIARLSLGQGQKPNRMDPPSVSIPGSVVTVDITNKFIQAAKCMFTLQHRLPIGEAQRVT